MTALVRKMGQDMALVRHSNSAGEMTVIRVIFLVLMAFCLNATGILIGTSYAQEKDIILSGSGIVYPGGYDLNTVGEIQGRISSVTVPESGPVRITLTVDKETYIALASSRSFWEDMNSNLKEGMEINVRGSKTVGKDGNLYIIAQEIRITGSKRSLVFRNESGEALWSNRTQAGRTGSQGSGFGSQSGGIGSSSGGSGSSSGGRAGAGSSGAGRGRR